VETISRVRVMVVDDSSSTRTMLREALALGGGIDVVGEAGSGNEAIARADELQPDVVLMDVRMPDGDGVEAARTINTTRPETKIVALTWSDDPSTVREMLAAGAIGYVVKGGTIDELCGAIRRAAGGEPELDQKVLPAAVDDLRRLLEEERTRREQIERLARAKEEFVQVLSHELRTPLTLISGALRMLQQRGIEGEIGAVLDSAVRRSGELEFLIEGLELIGAGPSGERDADIEQAVATAARRLGLRLDMLRFQEETWTGVPHRYAERVAFELLSNAIKHGRRPIEITARREGTFGIIRVTDAGGWTPPYSDFSAFTQEDMSTTRSRGGFGLGLFLVSRLCQSCEGELGIRAVGAKTIAEAQFRLPS